MCMLKAYSYIQPAMQPLQRLECIHVYRIAMIDFYFTPKTKINTQLVSKQRRDRHALSIILYGKHACMQVGI